MSKSSLFRAACAGVSTACLFTQAASADEVIKTKVTVVKTSTSDSSDRTTIPYVLTLRIHGDKARIELPNQTALYDSGARKVYWLNTDKKTYTVVQLSNPASDSQSSPAAETTVDLNQTSDRKTVADMEVRRYSFTGSVHSAAANRFPNGFGGSGRHRRGGYGGIYGGSGGGYGGSQGDSTGGGQGGARRMRPIELEGDYWLAQTSGSTALTDAARREILPAAVIATLPDSHAIYGLAKAIGQQLSRNRQFPLASRITELPPMRSLTGAYDAAPGNAPSTTTEVTTEVTSITTEANDSALFTVPADYIETQVEAARP